MQSSGSCIEAMKPQLSGLRSSIEWLHSRGVSAAQLGALFQTNANHIRQLVYRARRLPFRLYAPAGDLANLLSPSSEQLRVGLNVRDGEDDIELTGATKRRIRELEADVERIATQAPDFYEGVRQLRQLLPYIGNPRRVEWLRLSALIHQHIAWFLGHAGYSTSAFEEAKMALKLSRLAYEEWQDPIDLKGLIETCLIASNSCLLIGDAGSSRKYLQIAKGASATIADPRGSEHHRQLGVAYFQLGEDELARDCFRRAAEAMDAKSEAENQAHLLMTSKRHLALLGGGNWDDSQEVLSAVRRDYRARSLQHVMMVNSAAAAGLLTGSPALKISAMELLVTNSELAKPYHQQLTRTALLSLTPELPEKLRAAWIRRALYENAFKDK